MILRLRGLRIDENVEIGLREKKERFFGRTVGAEGPGEGGIICTFRSVNDQLPDFFNLRFRLRPPNFITENFHIPYFLKLCPPLNSIPLFHKIGGTLST